MIKYYHNFEEKQNEMSINVKETRVIVSLFCLIMNFI